MPAPLLACPFCRELFGPREAARCPDCGVDLRPMHELPPSLEAQAEAAARGELLEAPEHRLLPYTYLGRGRGLLMALVTLGLASFLTPWVSMTRPELIDYTGLELARTRLPYLWMGAFGYLMVLLLLWTRRTLAALRKVRLSCALLAALTAVGTLLFVGLTPGSAARPQVAISWAWGLWCSVGISLASTLVAARLGGDLARVEALPWVSARARQETSDDEVLH